MNEAEGCRLLKERFEAAGLRIVENHPLEIAGTTVTLDGWDPDKKVGYEYVTTEAGDREEFTEHVIAELEAKMARGELVVFLLDEKHAPGEASLGRAAGRFLDALRKRGILS